jgi:uncharacterized protein (TIGR03083 family)
VDTFTLIAAERRRLADELGLLSDDDWTKPSLCDGWTTQVVAAHLNGGWAIGRAAFVRAVLANRGNIDAAMNQATLALAAKMTPEQCVEGLRTHAGHRFKPPGLPATAPLTDVVVHGADILRPLGRSVDVDPAALAAILDFLSKGKALGFTPSGRVDGLSFEATDLGATFGTGGAVATGPSLALCGAILGRRDYLGDLDGSGAEVLARRI